MGQPSTQFDVNDAKTNLSQIIARVEACEEIVICRGGHPVAKLVRLDNAVRRTARGSLRDKITFADDWDTAETNDAIAGDFELR